MNNDLISREDLKKAIKDEFDLAIHDGNIMLMSKSSIIDRILAYIDNAPTVEPEKAKESEIIKAYTKGFDTGVETVKNERAQGDIFPMEIVAGKCPIEANGNCPLISQGEFNRKDLESWLYQIAMNNIGTDFEKSVVEIIHRLDGFERFVSEQKDGAV